MTEEVEDEIAIIESLNELSERIKKHWTPYLPLETKFSDQYGTAYPALCGNDILELIENLIQRFKKSSEELTPENEVMERWDDLSERIDRLTYSNFSSEPQNWIRATLDLIQWVTHIAPPLLSNVDWSKLTRDHLPRDIFSRLDGLEKRITSALKKSGDLDQKIKVIEDAHLAADRLPTDMQELRKANEEIKSYLLSSNNNNTQVAAHLNSTEDAILRMQAFEEEARRIVAECDENYNIATSKGLAGAFTDRSKSLQITAWVWVTILVIALIFGTLVGGSRFKALMEMSKSAETADAVMIFIQLIGACMGIGAAAWIGWVATRNISQSFKLSEDYAFKASVSKAYQGYRKEAISLEGDFAQKLFGSTLTRLDEAPIRLLERKDHGSPMEAMLDNPGFKELLKTVPEVQAWFVSTFNEGKAAVAGVAGAAGLATAAVAAATSSDKEDQAEAPTATPKPK